MSGDHVKPITDFGPLVRTNQRMAAGEHLAVALRLTANCIRIPWWGTELRTPDPDSAEKKAIHMTYVGTVAGAALMAGALAIVFNFRVTGSAPINPGLALVLGLSGLTWLATGIALLAER